MNITVIWSCEAGILELVKRMVEHLYEFSIRWVGGVAYLISNAIKWSMLELWLVEIRVQVRTEIYPEMVGL